MRFKKYSVIFLTLLFVSAAILFSGCIGKEKVEERPVANESSKESISPEYQELINEIPQTIDTMDNLNESEDIDNALEVIDIDENVF